MKKQSDLASKKEPLNVSCFFQKDGPDLEEMIEQSFRLFLKSELMKQCS